MKRIFYLMIILGCLSCEDDESFTVSQGLRLDFPADTLMIDTVFSRTPSSTYSFWVHNRNDDGILISTVKLRRGNQSGYRVNVDGVYLDNANGSQASDVEIRRNDSILVFVELTAAETRQSEPTLVEDDLQFFLESGVAQKVCLQAWAWDAQKLYSPEIKADTVIESEIPVVIYGDMVVDEGVTLTIKNTTLYFHDSAGLDVYGTLKTEGCTMRGDRLDRMFSYLPYDRVSGQWNGVYLYGSSTDNELIRTEIRNANYGIVCDSAALDENRYRLSMAQCVVHNCVGVGVEAINANVWLDHCQLTNMGGDCLAIVGGIAKVDYCTIAQFYPFSADRGAALRFANYRGKADLPLYQLSCIGSILTGYAEDVVMGESRQEGEADFAYSFADCLLRTPKVETADSLYFANIIWETPKDSVQGRQHFVAIDEDLLLYNFHLDSLSTAKGLGCYDL